MAYDGLLCDRSTSQAMGAPHRGLQRRRTELPARSRTPSPRAPTSGPPRRWKNGVFDDEVVPVAIPQRKGDPVVVSDDEGVRGDTTAESLAALRPAFAKDGTITAGSASQISDGAAAVVVMSKAEGRGARPRPGSPRSARHGMVAGPDSTLQLQPANAIKKALREGGHRAPPTSTWSRSTRRSPRSASHSTRELGIDEDKVNVNGGAIALGHPVGMSGARIALHLALELKRRGGGVGAAALCGGGGQGDALILRVPAST